MIYYYGDDVEEYRRWEDYIKMDLKEMGVDGMDELMIEIIGELFLTQVT